MQATNDNELAALVAREPWRQRIGYPNTLDDPLFIPAEHKECDGEVEYEPGSKYWRCTQCGYVGWATSTKHYPLMDNQELYAWCREFFREVRRREGELSKEEVQDQMYFVMAIALKRAATKKPEQLRAFIEGLEKL